MTTSTQQTRAAAFKNKLLHLIVLGLFSLASAPAAALFCEFSDISTTHNSCPSSPDGTITATVSSNATTPLTYTLTGPVTRHDTSMTSTFTIMNLPGGTYILHVMGNNGVICTSNPIKVDQTKVKYEFLILTPANPCTCSGIASFVNVNPLLDNITLYVAGPDYTSLNSVAADTTQTITLTGLCAGNYIFQFRAEACILLSGTFAICGGGPAPIDLSITGNNSPYQIGDTISLNGNFTTSPVSSGPFSYMWTGPSFTETTQNVSFLAQTLGQTGTYTFTVTNEENGTGCATEPCQTASISTSICVGPVVKIVGSSDICGQNPVTLAADVSPIGSYNYTWTRNGTFVGSGDVISVTETGLYTVHVSSVEMPNCIVTAQFNLTSSLSANVTPSPACIPQGGSVTLTANPTPAGNYTYTWSIPGDGTFTGNPLIATVPGTYTVTVTDPNHATECSTTATATLNQATLTFTTSADCAGNITITGTANPSDTIVLMGDLSGTTTANPTTGDFSFSFTGKAAGTYNFVITATTPGPIVCTTHTTGSVVVPTGLDVTITGNLDICGVVTPQLTANVTNETGSFSYLWTPNGQTTPTITVSTPGTYGVTVTDITSGCKGSQTVVVNADLSASVTPASACLPQGGSVLLTALPNTGNYTYSWSLPGGGTATGNPLTATEPGIYTVTITDPEHQACIATASATIVQATLTFTAIADCSGNITIAGTANPSDTVMLSGGELSGTTTANPTTGDFSFSFTGKAAGTYNFVLTATTPSPIVCTTHTTGSVVVPVEPIVAIIGNFDICGVVTPQLTATVTNETGSFSYLWTPNGQTTPTITVSVPGTYGVTVTDTTTGCQGSQTAVVNDDLSASITPASACIPQGGSVVLTALPSTGNYTYSWSLPGGGTSSLNPITATEPGTYTVTIKDPEHPDCQATTSATLGQATLTLAPATADCLGNVTISGTANPLDVITASNGLTGTGVADSLGNFTITITGVTPGSHTFTVTATNTQPITCSTSVNGSVFVPSCVTQLALFQCCPCQIPCNGTTSITVSVRNAGTADATGIILNETFSSCLSFVSGSGTGWSFTPSGNSVIATYNNPLPAGQVATFTLNLQAECCCKYKKEVCFTTSAVSDHTPTPVSTTCKIRLSKKH